MRTLIRSCSIFTLLIYKATPCPEICFIRRPALLSSQECSKYPAPLHNCDNDYIIPDVYLVYLAESYSLEQHKSNVGDVLKPSNIQQVMPPNNYFNQLVCAAELKTDLLAVIRIDEGVTLVECNGYMTLDSEID